MKETIGIKLTEIASKYVDTYFAEAQTEEYPFAVYTSSVSPVYTKDGIHHYEASVNISVFAQELERVNDIVEAIASDIDAEMTSGKYASRCISDNTDCTDEVWSRELSYTFNQYE